MIKRIAIKGPACYKKTAVLTTDKNINLIYGINGSGKSTLSEFLRQRKGEEYHECLIEPDINEVTEEILVYNEKYVEENFYNSDSQKGVFSLTKENAEAIKKINDIRNTLKKLQTDLEFKEKLKDNNLEKIETNKRTYINRLWEIKQKYCGEDRVLDYCFTGLKNSKESLFNYILKIENSPENQTKNIDEIKYEVAQLNKLRGTTIQRINEVTFNSQYIEDDKIFQEVITGNPNSRVAKLIDNLHISDWVKDGLNFESLEVCPFCQRPFDDGQIISELKAYFNKDYEQSLEHINSNFEKYKQSFMQNDFNFDFTGIDFLQILKDRYDKAVYKFKTNVESNLLKISDKIKNPSQCIKLTSSTSSLREINSIIFEANQLIDDFNTKILSVDYELKKLKQSFWRRIRFEYDQSVRSYMEQDNNLNNEKKQIENDIHKLNNNIQKYTNDYAHEQNNIINIDESIAHINSMLQDMGIYDFRIQKYSEEGLYRVVRGDDNNPVFRTLSEGERTIISVLYFLETCKGSIYKGAPKKDRIIVIDDPISSLSNIYFFNIGRILKGLLYPDLKRDPSNHITGYTVLPKFEQVFILTHSLYFFYEMTEMNKDKRHASQALFRIVKTKEGSEIHTMHYEHIQSDYHSYWLAIKDQNTHPALIANCMRNIVEYFFNFVEKRDLNNVFNREVFKQPKYQAFLRYINRESHSLGQNIYDFKEFDYNIFHEALRLLFIETQYEEHYKKMMSLKE